MKPDISVFFPAYNEEENIQFLVKSADSFLKKNASKYEIIIVLYSGCTDGSLSLVRGLMKKNKHLRLVLQPKNHKGVGYAINMGFSAAKYGHIVYSDSDNQFRMSDLSLFFPYLDYDIVAGYRIGRKDPSLRIFTSWVYNLLIRAVFGIKEKDVDCAFRMVKKNVFDKVKLNCKLGLGTSELLIKAHKYGLLVKQIGVKHYPRMKGTSVFEGKGLALPRFSVVVDLVKEIVKLRNEVRNS